MGLNRLAEWLGAPLFIIAQSAPLAALIPILTFAYGIGLMSKVMTVCIMAMPVIVLNRSEEHTSELQSLMRISYAVFCLKKKTKEHINKHTYHTVQIKQKKE